MQQVDISDTPLTVSIQMRCFDTYNVDSTAALCQLHQPLNHIWTNSAAVASRLADSGNRTTCKGSPTTKWVYQISAFFLRPGWSGRIDGPGCGCDNTLDMIAGNHASRYGIAFFDCPLIVDHHAAAHC